MIESPFFRRPRLL